MLETTGTSQPLRFVSFLSPLMYETYAYISQRVGMEVVQPTALSVGQSLTEFAQGKVDVGFICGLLYVRMSGWDNCPVELLAAPVLRGKRYEQQPIYFSDVLVRNDSTYQSFADLAGCVWAYNEPASHSGYNLVCHTLLERDTTLNYFGRTVESGSHLNSLQLLLDGYADATALDSHLFDLLLQRDPTLATRVRVIDTFGPTAIPPVVVAKNLQPELKDKLRTALVTMHEDPIAAQVLHAASVERFVPVADRQYQSIRAMYACVQTAQAA